MELIKELTLLFILIVGILIPLILFIIYLMERDNIKRIIDIKDRSVKNEKYKLFNEIDSEAIEEKINNYIENYINRYILYKFIAQKVIYINQDDLTTMINDVTKNIIIDISELYTYYISLIYNIDGDESLISIIKNKVTNSAVEIVTNYNSAMIPEE